VFKLPIGFLAFSPGLLLGVARSNDRAGFCPRKFFPPMFSRMQVAYVLYIFLMLYISCLVTKRTVLSSSKQTTLCSVYLLDTGCLQFVLFAVHNSNRAMLLVVYCIVGYWHAILFIREKFT